jgi:1-acyl-sn-glycerol-3-phosphate acyltransferase
MNIQKKIREARRALKIGLAEMKVADLQNPIIFRGIYKFAESQIIGKLFNEDFLANPAEGLEGVIQRAYEREPIIILPTHETSADSFMSAYALMEIGGLRMRFCAGSKWFESKLGPIPAGLLLRLAGSILTPEIDKKESQALGDSDKDLMVAYGRLIEKRLCHSSLFGPSIPVWLAPQGTRSKDGLLSVNEQIVKFLITRAKSIQRLGRPLYIAAEGVQMCPAPDYAAFSKIHTLDSNRSQEYTGSSLRPYVEAIRAGEKFDGHMRFSEPIDLVGWLEMNYGMKDGKIPVPQRAKAEIALAEMILGSQLEQCVVFKMELVGVLIDHFYMKEHGAPAQVGASGSFSLDEVHEFLQGWLRPLTARNMFQSVKPLVTREELFHLLPQETSQLAAHITTDYHHGEVRYSGVTPVCGIWANGANQLRNYIAKKAL